MWRKGFGSQQFHSHRRQKMSVIVRNIAESRTAVGKNLGGGQSRNRSRWSDCQTDSRCSKAADESCVYQKGILVQKKSSVIGGRRIFLTKMHTTDGKGICRSSWRKCMRCPRRLRVPSLNKIARTEVRPFPLREFRAANCFRDLIVALQNENPRWSGLLYLNRITGTRRSVCKRLLC